MQSGHTRYDHVIDLAYKLLFAVSAASGKHRTRGLSAEAEGV